MRPVRRGTRPRASPAGPPVELAIDRLGSGGDGLASLDGQRVAVPFALPGERVRARLMRAGDGWVAQEVERLSEGSDRIAAPCQHFGRCGGCTLQHVAGPAYAEFKRGLVQSALRRQGIGGLDVASPILCPSATRRRAALAGRRLAGGVVLGFNTRASHTILDLAECPVLHPGLVRLIAPLRRLLSEIWLAGEGGDVVLTLSETGIDVVLGLARLPELAALERLSAFAVVEDLARLSWRIGEAPAEPVTLRRMPVVRPGGIAVDLPPGGFLQATEAGEQALAGVVLEAAVGATRALDLFAGIGTFAFRLAAHATVHAVEGDPNSVAAMAAAGRRAQLVGVTTERRDLAARPLAGAELDGFDLAVFDPPRVGARAQAEALAASRIPIIVAVSCNPASFARDAGILIAGGYTAELVQPVDQFVWSAHIELAAVFRRTG
ncbi:MAG TPA: class I SAM-dependent RNA methyltransferase [Stellaceae bacterium]|nr:class I SAM-dependent RNA methyltransferase [Stellaceae bacterium]